MRTVRLTWSRSGFCVLSLACGHGPAMALAKDTETEAICTRTGCAWEITGGSETPEIGC
jgi:hypothetical protein